MQNELISMLLLIAMILRSGSRRSKGVFPSFIGCRPAQGTYNPFSVIDINWQ